MDTAIVAGAFALGGVVLGGAMNWATGRGAARRAVAGQRDEAMAALADVCVRLRVEARTWRDLRTPKSKLQQLLFGVMESEARLPVALAPNAAAALTRLAAGSVAYGMRNAHPVAQAEELRRQVMPLLSEVTVLSMRLSMSGDEGIKAACVRVSTAAVALIENITERPHDYARREAEVGPWLASCGGPGRGRGPVVVAPEDAAGGQPVGPAAALAHGASSPSSTAGAVTPSAMRAVVSRYR